MKTKRIILSLALVFMLMLSFTATAFAATVTVYDSAHTFEAYQIFAGITSDDVIGNIEWGEGINASAFLAALKADTTIGYNYAACDTAAKVAEALATNSTTDAETFAKLALTHKVDAEKIGLTSDTITLDDGYYLIVDTTEVEGEYKVKNPALLQLVGDINIKSKTDKPTVDKQVKDENADAETGAGDGWGETADHELFETFQFKLTANLPKEIKFDRYETYKVKFTDEWSAGISFESIESVTVNGVTITESKYNKTITGNTMTIDIPDIKTLGVDLSDGADVVVIYNAHLNENAIVANATTITDGTADDNQNKVYLEYSNNPDLDGLGKTPEDYVFVFTYESDNTKFDGEPNGAKDNTLAGAGFKLYKKDGVNTLWAELNYDNKIIGWGNEADATEVESGADGKFSFIGLDAGTYYLKETTTPAGYNTCDDVTVTVTATHTEKTDGVSAEVKKNSEKQDPTVYNDVVNNKGTVLPETGGLGTTLFYVFGSLLAITASILLVVRKRMNAYTEA